MSDSVLLWIGYTRRNKKTIGIRMIFLSSLTIVYVRIGMTCTGNQETKVEKSEPSTFEVCAIHELEVKSGVDLKEFESFVMKEIAPIYNNMKGQNLYLVKGDRGIRTDKYSIILTISTL